MINITERKCGNAKIYANDDVLFFAGEIDCVDPSKYLTPFFKNVLENISSVITLNFENLEFINSSGIKCIVSFILEKDQETRAVFVIDPDKTWQIKTLEIVQSLDEDNIEIRNKE